MKIFNQRLTLESNREREDGLYNDGDGIGYIDVQITEENWKKIRQGLNAYAKIEEGTYQTLEQDISRFVTVEGGHLDIGGTLFGEQGTKITSQTEMKKMMLLNTCYSTAVGSMGDRKEHRGYTGLEEFKIEIPEGKNDYQYVYQTMERISSTELENFFS